MSQYIDKSTLTAWIKEKKIPFKKDIDDGVYPTYLCALMDFEDFLDTLEMKEVDLEKELETLDSLLYDLDGVAVKGTTSYLTVEDVKDIAKHFFELGLKAQKGK